MTFFEALYGSQYDELKQKGKDGNAARFNGNIFFAAFIIVILIVIILLGITLNQQFGDTLNDNLHNVFASLSGRSIGKLIALPILFLIYFIISKTIGSQQQFQKYVEGYTNCPQAEKDKANRKILIPFFILLAIMLFLAIKNLGS